MRVAAVVFAGYGAAALHTGFGVCGVLAAVMAGGLLFLRDEWRRDGERL